MLRLLPQNTQKIGKTELEIDPQLELQLIAQAEQALGNPQLTWFDSLEELIADLEN